ncbi:MULTISPECIES: MaoC family dehydratase [unclassified Arthrobacter]|jgi:acyl dehydratase|uniref:MaoC family dehydratase n=1 Tax=unclassified Arthrobacter TaxID=235627 RepID=UPI000C9EBCC5|nr:MaoC family dehydratase [Arthrobacter sp. AFG20]PNH78464.1 dehydratase [Arthrobacter sp. AFG20]
MAGMYYEDFQVGEVIRHEVTRTVTETDNLLITALTMNVQPLHLDAEFSAQSMYGKQIVNSIFTLGLVTGIPVQDTTLGTTLGNLGFRDIEFPKPVFFGDTLRVETEALDKRVSNSRPETGIVGIEHRGYNQHGDVVCVVRRTALMKRNQNAEAEVPSNA